MVTQSPDTHRGIQQLLSQLRETRSIQITVETRFLTVQRNFLEEVGLDIDFLFPAHQVWGNVGPIAVQNNTSYYTSISKLSTGVPPAQRSPFWT